LQADGGFNGTGANGAHGAGGAAQTGGVTEPNSLLIAGNRGGDGYQIAGITFPGRYGSIGQGGQGGYASTGGANADSSAGANGVVIITEYYV
jgi:hypothetical protein